MSEVSVEAGDFALCWCAEGEAAGEALAACLRRGTQARLRVAFAAVSGMVMLIGLLQRSAGRVLLK
jgi:hypothetical protein